MQISDDGLAYLCGGEMDFAEFCLDITSDDLDPKEITDALGVEPTYWHRKGETNRTGKAVYKFGRWQLSTGRRDSRSRSSAYEAFDAFIRTLPGAEAPWVWAVRIPTPFEQHSGGRGTVFRSGPDSVPVHPVIFSTDATCISRCGLCRNRPCVEADDLGQGRRLGIDAP